MESACSDPSTVVAPAPRPHPTAPLRSDPETLRSVPVHRAIGATLGTMSARLGVIEPALVGRPDELGDVSALLERAGAGQAGALLISGDAGVGKTALVQQACAEVAPSALVLTGSCLPLT
jgi:hypothetical protein